MVTRTRGISFVEVLVALALIQIGVLGTVSVVSALFRGETFSRNLTEASALAQSRLESLVTVAPPDEGQAIEGPLDAYGHASPSGAYTRTTTVSMSSEGLRRIEVQVTWRDLQGVAHRVVALRDRAP